MKVSPQKRHLVYSSLLYSGLALPEDLARQVTRVWYKEAEYQKAYPNGHASNDYCRVYWQGIRETPDDVRRLIVTHELSKKFDLEGVPGFYKEGDRWRLNLTKEHGALVRPYFNGSHFIAGLLIFKHLNDRDARLLTSRNLPLGAKAEPYYPERMAA